MKLLFVHGWSVTDQNTYGGLPEALQQHAPESLDLEISHIFLGKYISFHDEVTLEDIARAFDAARRDAIGEESFSCITHSTGGPVVRLWAHLFYGNKKFQGIPLKQLIMLAPANHGSALAQLGKTRLSRLKSLFEGVEPGVGVLNWLELGSAQQFDLNRSWLAYDPAPFGFYQFVLSGQTYDKKFYDFLNPYLVEKGSDGVVRLAAANMNYRYIRLHQDVHSVFEEVPETAYAPKALLTELKVSDGSFIHSPETPFCVIEGASHSGDTKGIMRSVTPANGAKKSVVEQIFKCLEVKTGADFEQVRDEFIVHTDKIQELESKRKDKIKQYSMFVFRVKDDRGNPVNDFDMLLLAGNEYKPNILPKGFFVDKQKNSITPNILTYYVNYTKLKEIDDHQIGIRIWGNPKEGFSHYAPAEFRSNGFSLFDILKPNETFLIDIELTRLVDENTFRFTKLEQGQKSFKKEKPSGKDI